MNREQGRLLLYVIITISAFTGIVWGASTLADTYIDASSLRIGGTTVIDSSRAGTLVTLDTGQGANELYDMDQNVLTTSSPSFAGVTISGTDALTLGSTSIEDDVLTYPQQPASYIIWKSGSTYYAKSGTDGSIYISGSNAATVIQATISALSSNGGVIFIKKGTYSITSSLTMEHGVQIIGEGHATVLSLDSDVTLFTCNKDDNVFADFKIDENNRDQCLFNYKSTGTYYRNIFQNIYVVEAGPSALIFYLRNQRDSVVEHCWIEGGLDAITLHRSEHTTIRENYIYNTSDEGIASGSLSEYNRIIGNRIESTGGNGIEVSGGIGYHYVADNTILNCAGNGILVSDVGIRIIGNHINGSSGGPGIGAMGNRTIIENNEVFLTSGYSGITHEGGNDGLISNNIVYRSDKHGIYIHTSENITIHDNILIENSQVSAGSYDGIRIGTSTIGIRVKNNVAYDSQAIKTQNYGVQEAGGDYNTIIGNDVRFNLNNIIKVGSNTETKGNQGYVTENAGNATLAIVSSSITVNHGCSYTPTLGDIQVTPNRDLGNCTYYWIDTITSTQFTIHVGAAGAAKNIDKNVYFLWSVRRH